MLPFWLNNDLIAWISLLISNSIFLFGLFGNIAGSAKYLFSATTFQLITDRSTENRAMRNFKLAWPLRPGFLLKRIVV